MPSHDFEKSAAGSTEKDKFVTEFCRLAKCSSDIAKRLLENPSIYCLCYRHLNHTCFAKSAAFQKDVLSRDASPVIAFSEIFWCIGDIL